MFNKRLTFLLAINVILLTILIWVIARQWTSDEYIAVTPQQSTHPSVPATPMDKALSSTQKNNATYKDNVTQATTVVVPNVDATVWLERMDNYIDQNGGRSNQIDPEKKRQVAQKLPPLIDKITKYQYLAENNQLEPKNLDQIATFAQESEEIRQELQEVAQIELGDFLSYYKVGQ